MLSWEEQTKSNSTICSRINPIFIDNLDCASLQHKQPQLKHQPCQNLQSAPTENPSSSGYGSHGGSSHEPLYTDNARLREDAVAILEQNANFVKSILVAVKNRKKSRRSVGSLGSSANGTLSTIPEGKIDPQIPKPVWPQSDGNERRENTYDSIVDDALLLYTSLNHKPERNEVKASAKDILKDISETINLAIEGKVDISPEQILKALNERLSSSLDAIQQNEEDIKRLSHNLSSSDRLSAMVRAFSNNSSSGNSSQSSPEWSRNRTNSSDNDEIYLPSSSSGFSDKNIYDNALPVFVHDDLSSVPNGMRNAMIYGTLCRNKNGSANEKLLGKENKGSPVKFSLLASPDAKPSVWEIYYGAGVFDEAKRDKGEQPAYFVSFFYLYSRIVIIIGDIC